MAALDTDALLIAVKQAPSQVEAWKLVVDANTKAFQKIRGDLDKCDNADKVRAIIADVEKAMQDLSLASQKVETLVKEIGDELTSAGEQYPVHQPLNPSNPVPWPPGYQPPETLEDKQMQSQGHAPAKEDAKAKEGKSK